jgi:L-lactate dehydrogenase
MKIGIVGTGAVGSTAAYALLLQGIGSELVLVDHLPDLASAHCQDLLHATPFSHPLHLRAGDYPALAGAAVVVLAAGVPQAPGESRLQLLGRNVAVFADIVPKVMRHAPDALLIVATNPLDVMTQVCTTLSGLPPARVIGTGTMLDTARFQSLLAARLHVSPSSVNAFVMGERGDSEVLGWSSARVAGMPLHECAARCGIEFDEQAMAEVDQAVRQAAQRIIAGKGATYYGIGAAIATLVRCILQDERLVLTACSVTPEIEGVPDVALSLPVVVGRHGVIQRLTPSLDKQERLGLHACASIIRHSVNAAMTVRA